MLTKKNQSYSLNLSPPCFVSKSGKAEGGGSNLRNKTNDKKQNALSFNFLYVFWTSMFPAQMLKNRFRSIFVIGNDISNNFIGTLIKIHFYSSENRKNVGKMLGFEKKYVVLEMPLIFQLWFSLFLFDSNYVNKLFGGLIEPCFRFFALYGRKLNFLVSNIAKFC